MHCQNCGKEVLETAEICLYCYVRVTPTPENDAPNTPDFSSLPQYYQDEFKKIFDSNETYKGKWNWAAFSFGPIWGLTKGVWLSSVINIVASFLTSGIVGLIYCFVFALRGNFMYYSAFVKKKQLVV